MEIALNRSTERRFCADYSKAAEERMVGTVKPVDLWILVEYRLRWPREAISAFSADSQQRLSELRSKIPKMRLALIKRPDRASGPLSVFWAFSREAGAKLYGTKFTDYNELSFNIDELDGEITDKIFAVCTHGEHDLCCAQLGNKIYAEMCKSSAHVWQISHIGGCRFAPNVVCLPHGIVYGRVENRDCAEIVSCYGRDSLVPSKLRGRACYSKPVQAAEHFLRTKKSLTKIDALNLTRANEAPPGHWSVTFSSRDANPCSVSISIESGQMETYKSCSASETVPRENFLLHSCAIEDSESQSLI